MAKPERRRRVQKMGNTLKLTEEARRKFLVHLEHTGSVIGSATAIGVTRQACYACRMEDPWFAQEWEEAVAMYKERLVEALEAEADRRGHQGVRRDIYWQGVVVGTKLEYSDRLLVERLHALAPDKYKQRVASEQTGPDGGPLVVEHRYGKSE
jgi:hypothetical protein